MIYVLLLCVACQGIMIARLIRDIHELGVKVSANQRIAEMNAQSDSRYRVSMTNIVAEMSLKLNKLSER